MKSLHHQLKDLNTLTSLLLAASAISEQHHNSMLLHHLEVQLWAPLIWSEVSQSYNSSSVSPRCVTRNW